MQAAFNNSKEAGFIDRVQAEHPLTNRSTADNNNNN
jgi:hypothetical protein